MIPVRVNFDPLHGEEAVRSEEAKKEGAPRRMMITGTMLEKYGYTDGCEGCRRRHAGVGERATHNEECRNSLWEKMEETEEGRRRKEREEERINRRVEEMSMEIMARKRDHEAADEEEDEERKKRKSEGPEKDRGDDARDEETDWQRVRGRRLLGLGGGRVGLHGEVDEQAARGVQRGRLGLVELDRLVGWQRGRHDELQRQLGPVCRHERRAICQRA